MSHDAGPDPAHRLDAARDADVDGVGGDQARDQPVGLLAAAALTVHRRRTDVLGQPGHQPAHPGDVVGLLPELGDAAADDLLDLICFKARIGPCLLDERPLSGAEQFRGMQTGQPTVSLSDGAAGGFDDDRCTHSVRLEHVSLL